MLVLIITPKGFSAVWDIKSGTIVAQSVFVFEGRENFGQGWKVCLGQNVHSGILGLGVGVEGLVYLCSSQSHCFQTCSKLTGLV